MYSLVLVTRLQDRLVNRKDVVASRYKIMSSDIYKTVYSLREIFLA